MRLKDNFFHIVESGDMQCTVAMNADHEIYKAHFPGNPVTPGVCLVQMATEIYSDMRHEQLTLAEIAKIKYRNVVKPEDQITFFFTPMETDDGSVKVKVVIKSGDKLFTEMVLVFSEERVVCSG